MSGNKSEAADNQTTDQRDSGDESEDESEVLEESPCGRWQKRREEVQQRDVPGIDNAFLAMDTEEGVEVVWNEVQISEKKSSRSQLEKIKQVFDNLIQLEHANIVKFHQYWTDAKFEKPRVIFITEYMTSGSLKQFLKKTKKSKTLKAWKRWCTQILSALSYLHSCETPIIHGNLTCDTIFIQHNGLIKIGSVAPDAIYNHVKTCKQERRNMHCIAPEYAGHTPVTTAVDIYSFGICALEMAVLEIPGNGDNGHHISPECIQKALESLDDPLQRDFISCCLVSDPAARPAARDLLFHTVLFEVHSLKLCSAHAFVKYSCIMPESMVEEAYQFKPAPEHVIAEITRADREPSTYIVSQANMLELEKFLEDVKNGVYPLTAFSSVVPGQTSRTRAVSPEISESVKSVSPEPVDSEIRLINSMTCQVRPKSEQDANLLQMTIVLHMDDRMYRQLGCDIVRGEVTPAGLADELVSYGFINIEDREKMTTLIDTEFNEISTRSTNGNGSHGSHGSNGSNGDGTIENGPNGNNHPSSALITA